MKKLFSLAFALALSSQVFTFAQAADLSLAVGATGQSDMTYRLSLGFDWNKAWWQTSTGQLTGYWDAAYTYWESGEEGSGKHSVSFTPVFLYEFKAGSVNPYIEAGLGAAIFSGTRVGNKQLGSAFNFESRLGMGLKFAGNQAIGIRAMHYSNAGIKQPNDGIESYNLYYRLQF